MTQPKISIVVATLNCAGTLQRCIDSLTEQSYPHRELIVMDGGSWDATREILKRNTDQIAYFESQPDRGVYHAWNKALEHVSGEWIQFMGSDDYYIRSDVLETLAQRLSEMDGSANLVYGKIARVSASGDVLEIWGQSWDWTKQRLAGRMLIPHGAAFHHKSLFERCGGFDESFRIAGDYEWTLRALPHIHAAFLDDLVVIAQRWDGMSSVPKSAFLRNAEMARARQNQGLKRYPIESWPMHLENCVYGSLFRAFGNKGAVAIQNVYRRLLGKRPVPHFERQG